MVYSGWTRRSFIWPAPLPTWLLRLAWIASTFAIDPHVALAVALGADHADRRLVDQVRIGAKLARNPDGLGRAAGMAVYEDELRICHG